MKKLLSILTIATLLVVTGCQTQNSAGRVLASTVMTVDAAMQGWGTYVRTAHPPASEEAQVKLAYEQYQVAEMAAEQAYLAYVKSGDVSSWVKASNAMVAARESLVTLIAMLNPPTK